MSQPRRDWSDARAKVDGEDGCRLERVGDPCEGPLEAAHVLSRKFDHVHPTRRGVLYVRPDRIVPLCRKHHRLYDARERDLLGHLDREEEACAVLDAGLENARIRLAPSEYKRVAA